MTTVVGKSKLEINIDLTCDITFKSHGLEKSFSASLISAFETKLNRTTEVSINVDSLGIAWVAGQSYSFVVNSGLTTEPDSGWDSIEQTIPFTVNPVPEVIDFNPNGNNITNNAWIRLTYDRDIKPGTGNYYLYSYTAGDTSTLIKTISVTSNDVTFTDTAVKINVLGYLRPATGYYLLSDAGVIKDYDNLVAPTLTSHLAYTTVDEPLFHDLGSSMNSSMSTSIVPKVTLAVDRYLSPAESDFYYVEDTQNIISGTPQVADYSYDGSGTYTVVITPSATGAVKTLTTTFRPGSLTSSSSFNGTTKVMSLSGTRDDVNYMLNALNLYPGVDYSANFTLSFTVTTPRSATMTKVQNILITTPYDIEITNLINISRTYVGNQSNSFFTTQIPVISDFDTASGLTYAITLTSPIGQFSSLSDFSDISSNWTYSGTREQVNAKFALLKFWPTKGVSSNSYFTYQQTKNSVTQVNVAQLLNNTSTATITPQTLTFTSTSTWAPTYEQSRYCLIDLLLVGGGGGGMCGGMAGGGGGVKEVLNQTFTSQTYTITVGTGGAANNTYASSAPSSLILGNNGTSSSAVGYTVTGGIGGSYPITAYATTLAGSSGTPSSAGAAIANLGGRYGTQSYSGGGGGGGAGGVGLNGSNTSGSGGAGGTGTLSSITGQYYGGGGGGMSWSHDANAAWAWTSGVRTSGGTGGGGAGPVRYDVYSPAAIQFTAGANGSDGQGGGGASGCSLNTGFSYTGTKAAGRGGDGIVIIKIHV